MPCEPLSSIRPCKSTGTERGGYWESNIYGVQPPSGLKSKRRNREKAGQTSSTNTAWHSKEARESLYWLRLLAESGLVRVERLAPILNETEELIAVITAIIVRAKRGGDK
jgi:hypothetical protein